MQQRNPEDNLTEALGFKNFDQLLLEATSTVERELALEDKGWINLTGGGYDPITPALRTLFIKQSRMYHARDPLAAQAIRIWTDYTFGSGMTWEVDEETTNLPKMYSKPSGTAETTRRY